MTEDVDSPPAGTLRVTWTDGVDLPSVGRIVHYMSFGTPGGEYTARCRAAVVVEVGQWVTTAALPDHGDCTPHNVAGRLPTVPCASCDSNRRILRQVWQYNAVALAVLNPTGLFFNGAGEVACRHDEPDRDHTPAGGTWHWPERVSA